MKKSNLSDTKNPEVWVIVFNDRLRWDFWTLFTWHRKHFDHCSAMRYHRGLGGWISVDWSSYGLNIRHMTDTEVTNIFATCSAKNIPMLKYVAKKYNKKPIFGYSCVTCVKHLLGFDSLAITPYQLYCALKKDGAKEIM